MNWFTACVLYVLIWWTALFIVLPIGTKPVAEPDEHTGWRGAPAEPRMWRKALWTTVLATVIWGACFTVIESNWISFRSGWLVLPDK
jgi:predicted secreted protein